MSDIYYLSIFIMEQKEILEKIDLLSEEEKQEIFIKLKSKIKNKSSSTTTNNL